MNIPKVTDLEVEGKRVLVRVDIDVPLRVETNESTGVTEYIVTDDLRIMEVVPTIKLLLSRSCRSVTLMGHVGHGVGEKAITTFSVWGTIGKLLTGETTSFWGDAIQEGKMDSDLANDGRVRLLENLRKYPGEENNDPGFAQRLAGFGDVYINEAFAVSHREHASIVGVPKYFQSRGVGLRFAKEIEILGNVLSTSAKPLVVVIGGAKIETKLPFISKMEKLADRVLVGGKLPSEIAGEGLKFSDKVIVASLAESGKDIDEESAQQFSHDIAKAGTIVWSGPMGMFEVDKNDRGTKLVAEAIGRSEAYKVAGGGDTEAAVKKFGLSDRFDWISIGGGAMLEFLATGTLPGIEAI